MRRWSNVGMLISFLFVYTEWGEMQSAFIWQIEYRLLSDQSGLLQNLSHPIILTGMIGQLALMYSSIVKQPLFIVNLCGLILHGLVIAVFMLVGLLQINFRILLSLLPFIFFACLFFINLWKSKKSPEHS